MMRPVYLALALLVGGIACISNAPAQFPNAKFITQCTGNDANTMLLVHGNGTNGSTTIPDSSLSARGNGTVNGSAAVTTSLSRFGGAGLSLGATGNYVTWPSAAAWQFGTADFTIDYWAQIDTGAGTSLFSQGGSTPSGWYIQQNNTGIAFFGARTGPGAYNFQRSAGPVLVASTWYHFAFVRGGSSFFIFFNGVSQSFSASAGAVGTNLGPSTAQIVNVGGQTVAGVPVIDEVRVSNIARWTANFTPPNQPYCP